MCSSLRRSCGGYEWAATLVGGLLVTCYWLLVVVGRAVGVGAGRRYNPRALAIVSRDQIQRFVDQVVQRFRPRAVILFGSYAYGKPTRGSDVDLMVIMPHRGAGAKVATAIRLAVPRSFPMDLKATTREWVDRAESSSSRRFSP